jgi:hypothetical protein
MATFAARPSATKAPVRKRIAQPDPAVPPAPEFQVSQEEIARRAFEKFAARGYMHGFDQQDWFDAEEELTAEFRDRQ